MIIESVGTSLVVGKLRRGRFSNIKDAEIHKSYLIIASFLLEFLAVFLSSKGYEFVSNNIFFIHLVSYSLLFIGIFFNIGKHSFKLILLGTLLNFIVIMLNGGQMPVAQEALIKAGLPEEINALINNEVITHTIITKDTILGFLGDVFYLPKPYPRPKAFSIGDVFMAIGAFIFIQENMVKKIAKRKPLRLYD